LNRLGIIAALPAEAKCLHYKNLYVAAPVEIQKDIFLCLSGMGYKSAHNATKELLGLKVDALISWGVAGAIDNSLNPGDLILAESIISEDKIYKISNEWFKQISEHFQKTPYKVFNGDIASNRAICASTTDKELLFQKTSALAVDMESTSIVELASANNIDFLVIRAIADDTGTSIPEAVLNHTDSLGKPDPIPFMLSCLKKPGQINNLFKLARCYKQALKTLIHIAPDLKKQHFLYTTSK